jgi:hypothetical protein
MRSDPEYEDEGEIELAVAKPTAQHGKSAMADMATPDDSDEDRGPKRTSWVEPSASDDDDDDDDDDVPAKRTRSKAAPSGGTQQPQRGKR